MAVRQQQYAVALQPVEAVVLGIDVARAVAAGQPECVAKQHQPVHVGGFVGQCHQHQVELSRQQIAQQRIGEVLAQEQLQLGVLALQRGGQAR